MAELGEIMASTPGIEEIQAVSVSSLMLFKITEEWWKWVTHQHPPFQNPIAVHTNTTDCSSGVATRTGLKEKIICPVRKIAEYFRLVIHLD